jgi:hypothetical protein
MNNNIDSQSKDEIITGLQLILKFVYTLSPDRSSKSDSDSIYDSVIDGQRELLSEVIREARDLSFTIQHEVVSCQLLIAMAPATGQNILGTYSFGLEKVSGSERRVLIKPKVITPSSFEV